MKPKPDRSLTQVLFSFRGRISRATYWRRAFPILLAIGIVSNVICFIEIEYGSTGQPGPISIVVSLLALWPGMAAFVKRLHDRNRSGWWLLASLIPIGGPFILIALLIEAWFLKGTEGENRFGPDPQGVSTNELAKQSIQGKYVSE
jgi:uncharacterized membrane protein YhaH (DUF805 family)